MDNSHSVFFFTLNSLKLNDYFLLQCVITTHQFKFSLPDHFAALYCKEIQETFIHNPPVLLLLENCSNVQNERSEIIMDKSIPQRSKIKLPK